MKRIAIIGAGNAGCISALELSKDEGTSYKTEITVYHDPECHPIEKSRSRIITSF